MSKNNFKPEIRFKNFTNAWEQRKLGEVFNQTVNYIDPKEADLELWSVTVENGLTPKTERYNREALVKKKDKFKAVLPGDIVYNPMNMTIGSVGFNRSDKRVAVSGYYVTMNMNAGFSNSYFSTWLPSFKAIQIYKRYATGSLIEKQRVQFPILSQIKTQLPLLEEQEKIGSFFRKLDNTIALHQHELTLLKQRKKAFLQKMFPKKEESIPALRFDGFTDEWEEVKLGDVLTERNVQHQPNEEYPLVSFTVENGVTPKTDRFNRAFLVKTSDKKYKSTELNDIVYNPANLKFGAIALNTYGKAVFSPIYVTFTVNADSDPYYMSLFVTRTDFINYSLKYQEGTVYERMSVKSSDLLSLDVPVPSLEEQQKIGAFFAHLDEQITQLEDNVEQYKTLKKAFLQKMFV